MDAYNPFSMSLTAIKEELLRSLFPALRADNDPDIERYFELRSIGRVADSVELYASKIKARYPDDVFRSYLLRSYRTRSPLYRKLLQRAYDELGNQILEKTKRTLKLLAQKARSFDPMDAYSTLRAAESILEYLPKERYAAIAAIERFRCFSDELSYYTKELATVEELIRAYLMDDLAIVNIERKRRRVLKERAAIAQRKALLTQDELDLKSSVARRREKEREMASKALHRETETIKGQAHLAFLKIRFSAADIARIKIPPVLIRLEDQTLAYCFKYWNLVHDTAFERVIFLYSKIHKTKHYDVFHIIRRSRLAGRGDDEILTMVMSVLTTGYYYSISGDAYLKRSWVKFKKKLEYKPLSRIEESKKALPRRHQNTRTKKPIELAATRAIERPLPKTELDNTGLTKKKHVKSGYAKVNANGIDTTKTIPIVQKTAIANTPLILECENTSDIANSPQERTQSADKGKRKSDTAPGSVSDQLRMLSGHSYDVYKDRFFTKVRAVIRRVLDESRDGHRGIFSSIPQEAEECVYRFLFEHYDDPYMDWSSSEELLLLSKMGFSLPSLDMIIKNCYSSL